MGSDPIPTLPADLVQYLRDAAKSVMKIKNIGEIKRCLDANISLEQWDPKAQNVYLTKGVFSELILHFFCGFYLRHHLVVLTCSCRCRRDSRDFGLQAPP